MRSALVIRYTLIALVVIMLSALAGWYLFLKEKRADITEESAGRGFGLPQPLGVGVGSTYENIISSFSTLIGGSVQSGEEKQPRLMHVGKTPTAGYGFVGSSSPMRLRFVERGSGYILEFSLDNGALKRLTNTLVPRTYEALVAGDHVIMRGVEETGLVTTVAGEITASTTSPEAPATLKQRRLVNNIHSIALNPSGTELFYIVDALRGGAGIRASWDEKKQKKVFDSAVLHWQIDFLADGRIMVTENASDNAAGHAYLVRENSLEPVVGDVQGLTFLPHPKSSAYLYGTSAQTLSLFAQPSPTSSPVLLPIRTIADKCVWTSSMLVAYCAVPQQNPAPGFLDRWYRGEVHTSDAWWKVDVRANAAEPLYSSANTTFDVEEPIIDESDAYIAFKNSVDKTLWLLRIEE